MDELIRNAAFATLRQLMATKPHLTSNDLKAGFQFYRNRIPFVNQQQGIFKPKEMQYLLFIRTVFPKSGSRDWYDDQRQVCPASLHTLPNAFKFTYEGLLRDEANLARNLSFYVLELSKKLQKNFEAFKKVNMTLRCGQPRI